MPEILTKGQCGQFGELNYFVLFLDFEYDLIKEFKDDYHGKMLELFNKDLCNRTNYPKTVVFRKEDCEFLE